MQSLFETDECAIPLLQWSTLKQTWKGKEKKILITVILIVQFDSGLFIIIIMCSCIITLT